MGERDPTALCDVAKTGILTAFCHAQESRSEKPLLSDPHAESIVDRLRPRLADSADPFLRGLAHKPLRDELVVHIALRTRRYDAYAREFAERNPGACVVNLGCGLDTRFHRIDDGRLRLLDLDLPEVIALKRELVEETDRYRFVGQSVLESTWLDRLAAEQHGPFLFLAEGLFMYLPPEGVRELILAFQSRFPGCELVFENVNSVWLGPALKWIIDVKLQKEVGLGKGTSFRFGVRDGHEIESWSPGIRFLEEWSYFDEDEPRIGVARFLGGWRLFRCTQWTLRYRLDAKGS